MIHNLSLDRFDAHLCNMGVGCSHGIGPISGWTTTTEQADELHLLTQSNFEAKRLSNP
jgi:hypothetical protein